jgi:Zinc finger, C2H2 type
MNSGIRRGIIYLVQPAELVGTNRYKVGHSKKPNLSRLNSGYRNGTRYLYVAECHGAKKIETKIIESFKEKFELCAGNEFFKGDEIEMFIEISKLMIEYRVSNRDINSEQILDCEKISDQDNECSEHSEEIIKDTKKQNTIDDISSRFKCNKCKKAFTRNESLQYHVQNNSCMNKIYPCKYCGSNYSTKSSMYRHIRDTCEKKDYCEIKRINNKQKEIIVETNKKIIVAPRNGRYRKAVARRSN